jgi:1,4-alpha-glucan branching enzyme
MGGELAEVHEWSQDRGLDWGLLDDPRHAGVRDLVAALNRVHAERPALQAADSDPAGFSWLDADDVDLSTLAFERHDPASGDVVVCVANLAGMARHGCRIGLPRAGRWRAALTTDDVAFGGHGGWDADVEAEAEPWQGRSHSVVLTLPALSVTYLVLA